MQNNYVDNDKLISAVAGLLKRANESKAFNFYNLEYFFHDYNLEHFSQDALTPNERDFLYLVAKTGHEIQSGEKPTNQDFANKLKLISLFFRGPRDSVNIKDLESLYQMVRQHHDSEIKHYMTRAFLEIRPNDELTERAVHDFLGDTDLRLPEIQFLTQNKFVKTDMATIQLLLNTADKLIKKNIESGLFSQRDAGLATTNIINEILDISHRFDPSQKNQIIQDYLTMYESFFKKEKTPDQVYLGDLQKTNSELEEIVRELATEMRKFANEMEAVTERFGEIRSQMYEILGKYSQISSSTPDLDKWVNHVTNNRLLGNLDHVYGKLHLPRFFPQMDEPVTDADKIANEEKKLQYFLDCIEYIKSTYTNTLGELEKFVTNVQNFYDNMPNVDTKKSFFTPRRNKLTTQTNEVKESIGTNMKGKTDDLINQIREATERLFEKDKSMHVNHPSFYNQYGKK